MAFPSLYNEVTHVLTKTYYYYTCCCCTHARTTPTGVPIAAFTYLLHLPLHLLHAHVLYLLLCNKYYVCDRVGRYLYCTYIMYARIATTDDSRSAC